MGKIEKMLRDCMNDVNALANGSQYINNREYRSKFAAVIIKNLGEIEREVMKIKDDI